MATDPAAPVVEDTETPTPAQVDVSTLSLGQLDDALARGEAVDDAQLTVMASQAYTQLMAATNNDPAAAIDAMQEGGLLNAEIAGKFKTAIEGAGGDAAKFAQEVVRDRESLAQLVMLQATAAAAGAGAAEATATATGFDNPEFQAKMMELFAKIFEPILEGLTGERIDLAGFLNGTAAEADAADPEPPVRTAEAGEGDPATPDRTPEDRTVTGEEADPAVLAGGEDGAEVAEAGATGAEADASVVTTALASDEILVNPDLLNTGGFNFNTDLALADYSGFNLGSGFDFDFGTDFDFGLTDYSLNDPYGFQGTGFNVFQTDLISPQSQFAGLNPEVSLMDGTTTIAGLGALDRFNNLSGNDPSLFVISDPQVDTAAEATGYTVAEDEMKLTTATAGLST